MDGQDGRAATERLSRTIEDHANAEQESIKAYRELAETCPDRLVAQIMRMVLEDEEHHHGTFRRIALLLRSDPSLLEPLTVDVIPPEALDRTLATLDGAVTAEREGAQQLRGLALQTSGLANGVISLALEVMARDSEKHALLLRFASERLSPSGSDKPGAGP